jgi:hypothetical protein
MVGIWVPQSRAGCHGWLWFKSKVTPYKLNDLGQAASLGAGYGWTFPPVFLTGSSFFNMHCLLGTFFFCLNF